MWFGSPSCPKSVVQLSLERGTIEGESPVDDRITDTGDAKSSVGWKSCVNTRGTVS